MLEQTGVQNQSPPPPPAASALGVAGGVADGKLNLPNMKKIGGHKIDVAETAVSSIYFAIGGLVAAIAVTGFLMYDKSATVMATEQAQTQYRNEVETQLNDELFIAQKKKVLEVGAQIDLLQATLTEQLLFSKVFNDIQANTFKQTRYNKVAMTDQGDIEVSGSVTQFIDMAKAIAALRNATTISDWELTSVNINSEDKTVEYTVRGKISLDAIRPTTKKVVKDASSGTTPAGTPTSTTENSATSATDGIINAVSATGQAATSSP